MNKLICSLFEVCFGRTRTKLEEVSDANKDTEFVDVITLR